MQALLFSFCPDHFMKIYRLANGLLDKKLTPTKMFEFEYIIFQLITYNNPLPIGAYNHLCRLLAK